MTPSRSRQHASPQAIDDLIRRARLNSAFIQCPDCAWNPNYFCDTCQGTGRIYIQDEPDFVTKLRNWWKKLPLYKRVGYIGCACMLVAFALIVIAGLVWP